jgi:acyl-CoA synthetase (AMP-forming)/AMP-acid ligase II
MAFVVLHPQHAARWSGRHPEFAEELKAHAKTKLPGFACPEWVEVVLELPVGCWLHLVTLVRTKICLCQKTSTGKILKTELRKIVAKL